MSNQPTPIAIIGMGCRFPGANNPQEFWQLLRNGVDAITDLSGDKDNQIFTLNKTDEGELGRRRARSACNSFQGDSLGTQFGGFIEQVDHFDNDFFDISPLEAISIDPQQRLLLEVGWEALEHAGLDPAQLAGTQGGVFVGISTGDYAYLKENDLAVDAYFNVGSAFSIAANRLSYCFDWHGPSWAVDTACSSSLVAVHQACQSLRLGECNLALVAGVNLVLRSKPTLAFAQAQMLAPDGRCKAFDARADGYVRGEGIGVVLLKPLADAVADRDTIYAVIRGSAVNQDGLSNGLMAPNLAAQVAVVQAAYEQAQVDPANVQYVEAHGTGTKLGDSIEIHALSRVLSKGRAPDNVCTVGSVKTNIGHLEAASGIAGLIKVILSMQHQQIPASLHFQTPNPFVRFDSIPLQVQQTLTPWPLSETNVALAGVHSFGFGGTNAHVVLESAVPAVTIQESLERPLHILTLSAKTKPALDDLVARYQAHLNTDPDTAFPDLCYTANTGRTPFNYRRSVVAANRQELKDVLTRQALGQAVDGCFGGDFPEDFRAPNIAFLFPGTGKSVWGLGRQLYETQPTFRQALEDCAEIWREEGARSLLEVLYSGRAGEQESKGTGEQGELGTTPTLDQSALFAVEYALYRLWQSWGIYPKALVGHDIGEVVAACVAGVFSLADGLKLVAMWSKVRDHASPIASVLDEIEHGVQQVRYSRPKTQLMSFVTGQIISNEVVTSDYWYQRLCSSRAAFSVNISTGVEGLHQQNIDIVLECGPQSSLLEQYRHRCDDRETMCLSSLCCGPEHGSSHGQDDDWWQMLSSLSLLYVRGVNVDWNGFDQDYPQRRKVCLPTYPFQRKRYWINSPTEQGRTVQPGDVGDTPVGVALRHRPSFQPSLLPPPLLQKLHATPSAERSTVLMQNLQHELQQILRLPQVPEPEANFADLGMDSLMVIALRNRLQQQLGKTYSVPNRLLLDYPNSYQLAEYLNQQLYTQPDVQTHSNVGNPAPEASIASPIDDGPPGATPQAKMYRPPQIIHPSQLFFWLKLVSMNIGMRFGIQDGISTDRLVQACNIVSDRYDTLTNIIDTQRPKTTGRHYSHPLCIAIIQHSPSLTIHQIKEQFWDFYRCPFDRQHGPLIRFEIHQGLANGRELWIALDHISFDGHSVSILFEDLNTLLRGDSLPEPQSYYDLPSPAVRSQDVAFWHQYLKTPPLLTIPKDLCSDSPGAGCHVVSRQLVDQLQEQYPTVEAFEQLVIAATVGAIAHVTQQSAFTVCMANKDHQRTPKTHRVFGPLVQTNLLVFRHIPSQWSALLALVVQETERIRPHRHTPDVIKYWLFQQRVFGWGINLFVSLISILLRVPQKFSELKNSFLKEASVQLWVGKRLRTFLKILPSQMNSQATQKTLVSINMFPTFISNMSPSQAEALHPLPRYDNPKEFTYVSCRFEGEGNGHASPVILVKGAGLDGQACEDIASHITTILESI